MPQILDYFLVPLYGQVCFADQQASLPEAAVSEAVLATPSAVVVVVADEPGDEIEVEVYLGADEPPPVGDLRAVFNGSIYLSMRGLLVFAPTGDEVLLEEVDEGRHRLAIFCNGPPTTRVVAILDGPDDHPVTGE